MMFLKPKPPKPVWARNIKCRTAGHKGGSATAARHFTVEHQSRVGILGGLAAVASGQLRAASSPEANAKGGRIVGRANVESGLIGRLNQDSEHQRKAASAANHVRHSRGGRVKEGCELCVPRV